jgi:hypothetical protein
LAITSRFCGLQPHVCAEKERILDEVDREEQEAIQIARIAQLLTAVLDQ